MLEEKRTVAVNQLIEQHPFYRWFYRKYHIPADLVNYEQLPVLTKDDLFAYEDEAGVPSDPYSLRPREFIDLTAGVPEFFSVYAPLLDYLREQTGVQPVLKAEAPGENSGQDILQNMEPHQQRFFPGEGG